MHARTVEDVPERTEANVEVRMVEVTPHGGHHGDREDSFRRRAEPGERQPLEALVDEDLHPVESPVADPVHRGDRVMDLVESPEPGHAMEKVVDAPLEEVGENQEE